MPEPVAAAPVAVPDVGDEVPVAEDEAEAVDEAVSLKTCVPQFWSRACSHLNCSARLPSPLAPKVALLQASYQNLHIWPGTVCSYLAMSVWEMVVPLVHEQV